MHRGLALLSLTGLTACQEPQPLFSAECNDGTRIAGARDIAESRCVRRGGVRSLTPLGEEGKPPVRNEQGTGTPS